jgi:hypothetical protein
MRSADFSSLNNAISRTNRLSLDLKVAAGPVNEAHSGMSEAGVEKRGARCRNPERGRRTHFFNSIWQPDL